MSWQLKQRQALPLEAKVLLAQRRVREWYDFTDGMMYVAFSGGKDSTVLLDIVRSVFPQTPAVFVDTGLEFPEIRRFVKTIENTIWLRPKMTYDQVVDHYGYPVVSKEQSQFISECRTTKSDKLRALRLNGRENGRSKIHNKWKYLLEAPFKISHKCCDVMKKNPSKLFEKETGRKPLVGTMAVESQLRRQRYSRDGCNSYQGRGVSSPLSVWLEEDVWAYIKTRGLSYSTIYDMGYERTGCFKCMFGCHRDKVNTFQRMAKTHPKLHAHVMRSGIKEVLDFMSLPTGEQI